MSFSKPYYLKLAFITLLLNYFQPLLYAQNDMQSWTSVGLNLELSKAIQIEVEEELRLKNHISEVDEIFTDLGLYYTPIRKWSFGGGVRFIRENDNVGKQQGYESHFRYHFDTQYKHKLQKFSLKYRLRYQNKNELYKNDMAKTHFRFKTYVTFNIKNWKFDPKCTAEIFYSTSKNAAREFDKYRLSIGTQYKFKSMGKLAVFYQLESQMNHFINKTNGIIGMKYSYDISFYK